MNDTLRKVMLPLMGVTMVAALLSSSALAAGLQKVSVRLAFTAGGIDAPIFVALGKGYFKQAGLDVDVVDGNGSTGTIQAVENGSFNIGIAGLGALAQAEATSRFDNITAVMGLVQKDPSAIITLEGSGIDKPKDLEGRRFATDAGNLQDGMIKAFAAANGIDMDKVKIIITENDQQALLKHDADFINEWANPDGDHVAKYAAISPPMLFADYGVNILGSSVIVRKDWLSAHEGAVKAFLAAYAKGHDDVQKDPAAALKFFMEYRPDGDPKGIASEIKEMEKYRHTARTEGKPFGYVDPEDLKQTISLLETYSGMPKGYVKPSTVYTDKYLPAEGE
ncbi:NitT/TauT family transport system substrate-binding protein [Faunimonas pinastri]|uniref:Thiamine pyrimidine synthase n=1 Tax=Faunimonas pinastri TaxID=1855383 RepID=A0A1H9EMS0_9HYPH|nr:ABC transporter substrate-binding protein [Faunimonas pinastri]SEQ27014.1 NitT/TauT family transport system substrate-binding protein [Faunimonas pinastri]